MKILHAFSCLGILFFLVRCTPQPTPAVDNVERMIKDTSYGISPLQKMDVYLPKNRNQQTPVIVLIHGGGWESGDKADMQPIIAQLKSLWPEAALVNMNYRLTIDTAIHHEAIMNDIKAAVKLIEQQHNTWQVSQKLYMTGASAGGHLAMLYTYKFNTDGNVKAVCNYFGPSILSDWSFYNSINLWVGKPVKDVLIKYTGSVWNKPLYDSLSPYHVVALSNKPTIQFHGTLDLIVPIYQSQWMHGRLDSLGVANEYYEYLDFHGFNTDNYNNSVKKMTTFFKKY